MIIFYYDIEKTDWAKTLYISSDSDWSNACKIAEEELAKNPHILSYEVRAWLSDE